MTDVKWAIDAGDAKLLRDLLAADRTRANAPIQWGRNDCISTHPLHYISDAIFEGVLDRTKAVPLVDALIEAGSDVNFHKPGDRETPLMGAANRGSNAIIEFLVAQGARLDMKDSQGRTAYNWAQGEFLATHAPVPKPESMALIQKLSAVVK